MNKKLPSYVSKIIENSTFLFKPLEDVAFFQEGPGLRNWQFTDEGIKVINVTNLVNGTLDLSRTNRYISADEVEERYPHFLIDEGDIVIASSGNSWGKVSVVKKVHLPLLMNTSVIRFKTKDPHVLNREFLLHFLNSETFLSQISMLITGSAQPNFGPFHLKRTFIPIPEAKEQKKIAAILSSVDEAIEKTEAIIEKIEKVKRGLMQKLLTKGIGHEKYKDTSIGSIPEDWGLYVFKDVCEIVSGQVDPKVEPFCAMPHLGPNNIAKFTGRILDYNTAEEEGITSGKYLFTEEHILFSKIRPELAKVAFPKFEGICSADIYPIKSKNACMIPEFIKYVLLSKRFYEYSVSASGRTGIPKVNRADLEIFQIPVPSLDEQRKIVSILLGIERKVVNEQKSLKELQTIKKALMQSLLTGKVHVTVDEAEVTQV
ncbi:restriction endonuclease subunit S [Bacillus nitratireducens]|uniref:restriction endonuclease subunit S n=1 Tax=Bacillus nitratireducens TaxID=2026193 RepID=UPI0013F4C5C8|nr:restriction endonuclease subunit S [Bacillus nitratireducens]